MYEPIHRPFGRSPFPFREGQSFVSPHDGDDEQESPSSVEKEKSFVSPCKGERARLRVGGSHA